MKKLSTPFLSVLFIGLVLAGCKKDKNDDDTTPTPPAPKTKTELISTGSWKFSKAMFGTINVSAAIQACQKDNIMTFQSSGNGTIDEGAAKCNAGDSQTNPFTWNFTTSESVLHVSAVFFTGGNNDFNVVEISETQLVGSQTISGQVVTVTFIH